MDTCIDNSIESLQKARNSTASFCRVVANSSPSNPVLFRQYTVREIVTPTKTGYLTVKEASFSFSFSDKFPISPTRKLTSDVPHESKQQRLISGNIVKLRKKDMPPFKKMKLESSHQEWKRSKGSNCMSATRGQISQSNERIFQYKKSHKLPWRCILFLPILPLLVFSLLSFLLFPMYDENLKQENNLKLIQEALKKDVFGQEEAILSLLWTLESYIIGKMVKEKMPVILLTGSNGVGKSLVASIITSNFPPSGEAELILLSPLPSCELLVKNFLGPGPHLIVVDTLNPQSATDTMMWTKNLLNEAVWQQKLVLVILIFNVQVWHDDIAIQVDHSQSEDLYGRGTALYSMFNSSGFTTHHVHFNVLSQEHVKSCIRLALRKRGLQNDPSFEKYVEMIGNQINYRQEGCKPVWSRANLIDSN